MIICSSNYNDIGSAEFQNIAEMFPISPESHLCNDGTTGEKILVSVYGNSSSGEAAPTVLFLPKPIAVQAAAGGLSVAAILRGPTNSVARLWDLSAKDPAANPVILRGHEDEVRAVGISPDNRWLVTGSRDHTARLWDLTAKDPAANPVVLRGHEEGVYEVGISPDNHRLVTGSADNTARLWDLSAKDPAANPVILRGHQKGVEAVGISPDNRWLVTVSEDSTRIWPLRVNDLIDLARVTVGRNFTTEEWKRYFPGEPYHKTFPDLNGKKQMRCLFFTRKESRQIIRKVTFCCSPARPAASF
jgi:hypothetical protein